MRLSFKCKANISISIISVLKNGQIHIENSNTTLFYTITELEILMTSNVDNHVKTCTDTQFLIPTVTHDSDYFRGNNLNVIQSMHIIKSKEKKCNI